MRFAALMVFVAFAALLLAPVRSQDQAKTSPPGLNEESAKKVKSLQSERIAALKSVAELASVNRSSGRGTHVEVFEANLQVLQAELDAAENETDRVAIEKKIVDELKQYEEANETMRQAARTTLDTVLKVKARRLEAEIQWEQDKAKAAPAIP